MRQHPIEKGRVQHGPQSTVFKCILHQRQRYWELLNDNKVRTLMHWGHCCTPWRKPCNHQAKISHVLERKDAQDWKSNLKIENRHKKWGKSELHGKIWKWEIIMERKYCWRFQEYYEKIPKIRDLFPFLGL